MARMITVEVKRWHIRHRTMLWLAAHLRDETFRCPTCHGKVRLMSASLDPPMAAHREHQRRHKGYPLGDCFDGGDVRQHPFPLT